MSDENIDTSSYELQRKALAFDRIVAFLVKNNILSPVNNFVTRAGLSESPKWIFYKPASVSSTLLGLGITESGHGDPASALLQVLDDYDSERLFIRYSNTLDRLLSSASASNDCTGLREVLDFNLSKLTTDHILIIARKITIARNFNGSYFVKYILKMASAVLEDRGHYSDSESVRELLKKYL